MQTTLWKASFLSLLQCLSTKCHCTMQSILWHLQIKLNLFLWLSSYNWGLFFFPSISFSFFPREAFQLTWLKMSTVPNFATCGCFSSSGGDSGIWLQGSTWWWADNHSRWYNHQYQKGGWRLVGRTAQRQKRFVPWQLCKSEYKVKLFLCLCAYFVYCTCWLVLSSHEKTILISHCFL